MRLSWNEIRIRAAAFARDWAGHGYEKGETQLFYRDFFEVFGMPVRRVAAFEQPVKNLGEKRGFIDLFWKGVLLVEQKSQGLDLERARTQAFKYFPGLKDSELPRYILVSDFQTFDLYDLEDDTTATFALADLPKHVEKFGFIIGVEKRRFKDQDPVTGPPVGRQRGMPPNENPPLSGWASSSARAGAPRRAGAGSAHPHSENPQT